MNVRKVAAGWLAVCVVMSLHGQAGAPASAAAPSAGPAPNSALVAPQTVFDATSLGSPLQLTGDWRVGISSDPNAALPSFDDSAWDIRSAQPFIDEVPNLGPNGLPPSRARVTAGQPQRGPRSQRFAWFRLHVRLAPSHGPVALLIEVPISSNASFGFGSNTGPSPDVFANGRFIQPEGPHGDTPHRYQHISRIYDLDIPAGETSLTLVVRTLDISTGYGAYTRFFAGHTMELGNSADLGRELGLWSNRSLFERLPRLIYSVLLAILAIFLIALYLAQKGHIEYLWLALHELFQAPIAFVELAGSTARLDTRWYSALSLELMLVSAYLFYEFLVVFLSLPRRWYIRWLRYTAPVLAAIGPIQYFIGRNPRLSFLLSASFVVSALWMAAWAVFIFGTLIASARRRNLEAGLLLVPLVLTVVGLLEPIVTSAISEEAGVPYRSPLTFDAGPIPIHIASLGDFAGIIVILLIIYFRFLRVHREQEHATSELAAARNVQELLIPREKISAPGFEIDSVYSPANEVGGDFFHVHSEGHSGMLVVIGDVAGKGLKAAMNVSLLMGALRRTHERSPAKILESLNGVLAGTDSLTTCQAIWFAASGEMVVANAGHLPPYINGQEVALTGSLPLGVLPQAAYEEVRLFLHPGDRILLLSDGVVEARQPSGELFGFDRVRNLSNQSAFYVADAAKTFGQQDDITVLTVRRQAHAMAA